jgi:hypothetical protein
MRPDISSPTRDKNMLWHSHFLFTHFNTRLAAARHKDDILRRFCHVICPNEKPAPAVRCISGPFTIGS